MKTVVAELQYEGKRYTYTSEWDETADYLNRTDDPRAELEDLVRYMWTDGNYGCDCNRFLFISYEYDDYPGEEDESGRFPCGQTVKLVSLTLDGKDLLAEPAILVN